MNHVRKLLLAVLTAFIVLAANSGWAANRPIVNYDQNLDKISILADDASLRGLLGEIAFRSGIEVSMTPAVERQVSLELNDLSLEEALQRMARQLNLNHMLYYAAPGNSNSAAKPLVVGMQIVGVGNKKLGTAEPILTQVQLASSLASVSNMDDQSAQENSTLPDMRWQSRLQKMPVEQRERLESLAEKMAQTKIDRDQHRLEREQKRQERLAARMETVKETNPDLYEKMQERQQRRSSQQAPASGEKESAPH